MAEEIRTETDVHYEDDCRKNANRVQTIHRRKVTTTTTYYSDGTSRVTSVERGDWFDTGHPC
nr:hypothetical protein [uncultured Brevundimonas sp.]